jgi:hypothetical protein
MLASSSRLDLGINVGPQKPGHIKENLSKPLPIFIEYEKQYTGITGSALWRMRAALRCRDRVRKICFQGCAVSFGKFFKATNHHFPALDSLELDLYGHKPRIPATFLRGPDLLDLRLRRLILDYRAPLSSVSRLLLSATALTDLEMRIYSESAVCKPSKGSSLLRCLQGMQCLRSLDLTTPADYRPPFGANPHTQHSTCSTPSRKDIVPLSKLTHFRYTGSTIFLNEFMFGLSAPSLQDAHFMLSTRVPLFHLSRTIDDLSENFRSVSATFEFGHFRLLSSTEEGEIDHSNPSFRFTVNCYPGSIYGTPSIKLAMAEELALCFPSSYMTEDFFSLREFFRQFVSVRVLRVDPYMREVPLSLQQDDGEAILPVLEEIELSISRLTKNSDEEWERHAAEALAVFEPFVSARKRAGRVVKVIILCRRHAIKTAIW